MNILII